MILTNEYKSNIGRQITWFIFILIMITMLILAYPIINDPSVQPIVENNLENIPEMIKNSIFPFGVEAFGNLELYYDSLLIFVTIMICIYSLNIGLNSVAKEQGFGTIEYLYINPISRNDILFNKYIANLISIFVLVVLIFLSSGYVFSYVSEVDFIEVLRNNFIKFLIIFSEGILMLSLGTMISTFSKRTAGLSLISTLMIFGLLVLNILISLEFINVGPIKTLIPFRTLQELDLSNIVNTVLIILISKVLISALLMILGMITYNNKDLII